MAPDSPSSSGPQTRRVVRMGKYEVVQHIATGGMGAVYRARDTIENREVALKVLPPELASKPLHLERFKREAQSASRLKHENIVLVHEFGEAGGTHYLAMEFVDGIDLHEHVKKKGPLDPEEARQLILQAARALRAADAESIVHRDIKPSNFLLTRKNNRPLLKLTDFGLAREVDTEQFRVTRAGTTVGTIDYMSPEQARDSWSADIRSDLYSLGATWYHLLAGHAPFPEGGLAERLVKIMEEEPPDVRDINPRVSDETWAILTKLLAKNPRDRFQTPAELIDDLLSLEGKAAVRPKAKPKKTRKKPRPDEDTSADAPITVAEGGKSKLWYIAGGIGAVVLAGVILVVAMKAGKKKAAPPDDQASVTPPFQPPTDGGKKPIEKPPLKNGGKIEVEKPPVKPAKKDLPALYTATNKVDFKALRGEIDAAWKSPLSVPTDAHVAKVGRGKGAHRTLEAACAAAPAGKAIVLEIADNGPLFTLPWSVEGRQVVIRAAKGYRPLLIWDLTATFNKRRLDKKTADPLVWLTLKKGSLLLDGVDLAWRWPEGEGGKATLFEVSDGEVDVRDCTISGAGKPRDAVTLLRHTATGKTPGRCRWQRCHVRGGELTLLDADLPEGHILLDGCLIACGQPVLIKGKIHGTRATTLNLVRSTLVCGEKLIEVTRADDSDRRIPLQVRTWDTLISRSSQREGGDLLTLPSAADGTGVTWKAVNTLYAGWQTLLNCSKTIRGDDLREWQRQWNRIEGEEGQRDPWPDQEFTEPATQPATTYEPTKRIRFASSLDPEKPLGCLLSALPTGRDGWLGVSLDPALSPLETPSDNGAPDVPALTDGKYHGGKIALDNTVNLGAYLEMLRKKGWKLGPKVVLHLSGKGEVTTDPIRVKGSDLIIYVDEPAAKEDAPLALKLNSAAGAAPLIEVEGGSLEMTNARLHAGDSSKATHLVKVTGGDIKMARCRLEGPQQSPGAEYLGAVSFAGSGDASIEKSRNCAINETLIVSGRAGVIAEGFGARLQVRQTLIVSGTEALHLLPGANCNGKAAMQCSLEKVTIAARIAIVKLGDTAEGGVPADPILVDARDCVYLNPFIGNGGKAVMLTYLGQALPRGLLLWRGKRESMDLRLSCLALAQGEKAPTPRVGLAAWKTLWGASGMTEPGAELILNKAFDPKAWPLDRLILPVRRQVLGANLSKLGIKTKPK